MKVCVVLTARPSWAKLSSVCHALKARDVELQLVVCASALLERYGSAHAVVEAEGFTIAERVYSVHEGENLETGAIEVGALQSALARTYARLKPDVVVVCADRREILAAAGAARMLEITIAHCQGGEASGSVDDDIRNAVTQLADIHLVCTERAKWRVYGLTGSSQIYHTGCPSIDLAKQAVSEPPVTSEELGGAGLTLNPRDPFIMVLQHPVTSEAADAFEQMQITLEATYAFGWPTLCLWPGEDAGAGGMSKAIRQYGGHCHTLRNLAPNRFLKLLTQCAAIVGNSSASVRECAYLGTPAVLIGSRQDGRECGPNVLRVPHQLEAIQRAIGQQVEHGPYRSSALYGSGHSGERIAEVICEQLSAGHYSRQIS